MQDPEPTPEPIPVVSGKEMTVRLSVWKQPKPAKKTLVAAVAAAMENPPLVTDARLRELVAADAVYKSIAVKEKEFRAKFRLNKTSPDLSAYWLEIYQFRREIKNLEVKIRRVKRRIDLAKSHRSLRAPKHRFVLMRRRRIKQIKRMEEQRVKEEYRRALRKKLGL